MLMMKPSVSWFLPVFLATMGSAPADVLYAVRGGDTLVRIDSTPNVATVLGPIGFASVGALAFGNDGTLYGKSADTDELITIDPVTGAGTAIGPAGAARTAANGLANHPTTDVLYGIDSTGALVSFSKSTGAATFVASTSIAAIAGLEFDANGQLWGVDASASPHVLVRIDTSDGAVTVVDEPGGMALPDVGSLAIGASGTYWTVHRGNTEYELVSLLPATGTPTLHGRVQGLAVSGDLVGLASPGPMQLDSGDALWGVLDGNLVSIDTGTLTGTIVGPTGFSGVGGLAFGDGKGGSGKFARVFGLAAGTDELVRIDLWSGNSIVIGDTGSPVPVATGLANDPFSGLFSTDDFFAVTSEGAGPASMLVLVSSSTGAATPIADTAADTIVDLAVDATGTLWGIDGAPTREELIRIDPTSGATTVVGPGGLAAVPTIEGLTFGQSGTLWAIDRPSGGSSLRLVQIDVDTGMPTVVGTIAGLQGLRMTALTAAWSGALNYCTAVPNSSGFPASISMTGVPSLTSSNLALEAGPVPANNVGVFFFGYTPAQIPFGPGFRCVDGTINRIFPPQISIGGVLSTSVELTPFAPFVVSPGRTLFFQAWFRDPGPIDMFNTSDGLALTVLP